MRLFGLLGWLLLSVNGLCEDSGDPNRRIYQYLEGRSVFEEKCSQCHGRLGKGDGEWARDWTENRPRNFRTGVFKFRSTPMGKLPTDADLRRTITTGISGTAMPAFGSHLRNSEYEAVIVYIKHLSKRWRDPENIAPSVETEAPPEWVKKPGATSEQHLNRGKDLFAAHCASCHGDGGKGDGVAAMALMDIWGFKITPADFTKAHLKSGPNQTDIYRTIAMGLDGTPMIGFRSLFSEEQIWQLVAYIDSLKEPS